MGVLLSLQRGAVFQSAQRAERCLVDYPDSPNFAAALNSLLSMPSKLKELHDIAWNDFPFDCATMARANRSRKEKHYFLNRTEIILACRYP
jgi:hypothetical protein